MVLERLSQLLADADLSLGHIEIFNCLVNREKLGSTGLGNGIAIPHGRLKDSKKPVAAFMQLKKGIDYDTEDNMPVDILFALLVPEDFTKEYLNILSHLSEKFSRTDILERLRSSSSTTDEIYQTLTD